MLLRTLVSTFLVPPALNIVIVFAGLLVLRFARRPGMIITGTGLISLWLLSTPIFSSLLHQSIEKYPALDVSNLPTPTPQAIIVLGSAHYDRAAEYGDRATPTADGLTRLHYAAYLHRLTGLPLLLTGGPMNRQQDVHSQVLNDALEIYGMSARWLEQRSATTWQNALFSAEILLPIGIRNVIIVTHSYHMQRAHRLFQLAGFDVLPAPTALSTGYPLSVWRYWLPDSKSLALSHSVLHEYLGLLWYQWVTPIDNVSEQNLRLPEN